MPEAMHMRGVANFETEEEHGYQRKVPKLTRTVKCDQRLTRLGGTLANVSVSNAITVKSSRRRVLHFQFISRPDFTY